MRSSALTILPLPVAGEVQKDADLAALASAAMAEREERWADGDVLVVTQKVVSKAEGRLIALSDVEPSAFAVAVAKRHGRNPRHIEVVLRESRRIVKMDRGILVTETHHGFVCANAGVDASNVDGGETLSLLPLDPDRSAAELRDRIRQNSGTSVAVIISDTFGRPWRNGLTNVAIGVAGIQAIHSYAGERDPYGYELRVTEIAVADELACAAELVMGKTLGVPFALVRGLNLPFGEGTARDLVRDAAEDLFR
jgi:coenzyme F420-0:L-glutamate ligase/coenzyme F420-1:gamma-L-glutamate ligase